MWVGIISRCENQNTKSYEHYGGKGVGICQRWRDSFEAFLSDMGPRPSKSHSVERKKNEIGYEPDNCVWATLDVQANNKSSNIHVTVGGETRTLAQWCELKGLRYSSVYLRIYRRGWDPERALSTPIRAMRSPIK